MTKQQDTIEIDFSKITGPVYIGRDRGYQLRKNFNLNEVDNSDTKVKVTIPKETFSINPSFFLAFFGESIRKCGTRENFLEKFEIVLPEHLRKSINTSISRALFEKEDLLKK